MKIKNPSCLIKYVKGFYQFEQYFNNINYYLGNEFKVLYGYLININDFERIKMSINYDKIKDKYINYNSEEFDTKKIYTLDEIEFRDSNYLLNMIFNKNVYIFINRELWKLLCVEGKENLVPITYEINYSKIKFKLNDQRELIFSKFKNSNNYIMIDYFYKFDNSFYDSYRINYEDIVNNIYDKIYDYYNFHKKFMIDLNYQYKKDFSYGFIVDKVWFNEWEKNYNYSNIKYNYLDNKSKKETINYLIYLKHLKKINSNFSFEPKIYKFKENKEFLSTLEKKKLIIINTSLITYSKDLSNRITCFYLYKGKIELNFEYNPLLLPIIDNNLVIGNNNK